MQNFLVHSWFKNAPTNLVQKDFFLHQNLSFWDYVGLDIFGQSILDQKFLHGDCKLIQDFLDKCFNFFFMLWETFDLAL